jgi:hypothetical protein
MKPALIQTGRGIRVYDMTTLAFAGEAIGWPRPGVAPVLVLSTDRDD